MILAARNRRVSTGPNPSAWAVGVTAQGACMAGAVARGTIEVPADCELVIVEGSGRLAVS